MSNQNLSEKIAELEKELVTLKKEAFGESLTYSFSKISDDILNKLFNIQEVLEENNEFEEWFNPKIDIDIENDKLSFLEQLHNREKRLLSIYNEEELTVKFIAPILNSINFCSTEKNIRDFYEQKLSFKTDKFSLNGKPDFFVAKGEKRPEEPYFFIQEFKKGKDFSDPQPQLLAEMIAGLELSNTLQIRGAYIIGINWYFVILNKIGNKYQYFISEQFNSKKFEDLKYIYKNLLFVKNEILENI